MFRLVPRLADALACLLLVSSSLLAQAISTASINGTVRDTSGGVLPGVTVTATQTATGLMRVAVTDDSAVSR